MGLDAADDQEGEAAFVVEEVINTRVDPETKLVYYFVRFVFPPRLLV